MYSTLLLSLLLSLLPLALASQNNCFDLTIPVPVSVSTYPLKFPAFKNGYEATQFLLQTTKRDAPTDPTPLLGAAKNITKTYGISARYCSPTSNHPHAKTGQIAQVLTHGLGFDKSYWHFGGAENNYALAANKAGYATLSYDRLGNGHSTIVDPYNEQQAQVELAILVSLTKLLKAGKISPKIPKPAKVVHVGHSYGSLLSNGVAAGTPDLTDGVVMTGFSHNTTWNRWFEISTSFHLVSENQPARFGNASSGHLTWADKYANQYSFLTYPHFAPATLETAEATKFPFSVGEFFTQQFIPVPAPKFAKPVMVSFYFLSSAGDAD
jgi:pimeloyl-ACP methyl ester carboxylesterase